VKAFNIGTNDEFGWVTVLSADGSTLAVGTPLEDSNISTCCSMPDNNGALTSGAVYVYRRLGANWVREWFLKASNFAAGDQFGYSLAISADGSVLVVGAHGEDSASASTPADNSKSNSGAAYVFRRTQGGSGPTWTEEAYLKASNADANDQFGRSVAITSDGNTLAVGATREDGNSAAAPADNSLESSGAVYIFQRGTTSWGQSAYLKPTVVRGGAQFGHALGLSADGATLVVGVPLGSPPMGGLMGTGTTYIMQLTNGVWAQQAQLLGFIPGQTSTACPLCGVWQGDLMGASVSISESGNVIAVGAEGQGTIPIMPRIPSLSGAVYIYRRTGTTWASEAYLKTTNAGDGDAFGTSVSLSADGETFVAGAPGERSANSNPADDSAPGSGAVYLFKRVSGTWQQLVYLKASNIDPDDSFGTSVALSKNAAVLSVGANFEASGSSTMQSDNTSTGAGAVYMHEF
jgi:hypothetical protein